MSPEATRIIELYQRKALEWVRNRERPGELFEKSWLERIHTLLPSAGSILDIGCGSAEPIARYLIERGHQITGVDSSAALIEICRTRFPRLQWRVADMRHLALGRKFNGVIAWDSFFHLCLDDQRQMFPIFREHAAPEAALMFTSGPSHGEAIGSFEGEPLYHASLDPAEYRLLLGQNGFRVVSHIVEDPSCGRHTIWLAQRD